MNITFYHKVMLVKLLNKQVSYEGKYVTEVPDEYIEMAFEAYYLGHISLSKLAKLLEIPWKRHY